MLSLFLELGNLDREFAEQSTLRTSKQGASSTPSSTNSTFLLDLLVQTIVDIESDECICEAGLALMPGDGEDDDDDKYEEDTGDEEDDEEEDTGDDGSEEGESGDDDSDGEMVEVSDREDGI